MIENRRYKNKSDEQLRNLKVDVKRISEWQAELLQISQSFSEQDLEEYKNAAKILIDYSDIAPYQVARLIKKEILSSRHNKAEITKWLDSLDLSKLMRSSCDFDAPWFAGRWVTLNLKSEMVVLIELAYKLVIEAEQKEKNGSFLSRLITFRDASDDLMSLKRNLKELISFRDHIDAIESAASILNKNWQRSCAAVKRIGEVEESLTKATMKLAAIERFDAKYGKEIAKGVAADKRTRQEISSKRQLVRKTKNCPYCNEELGNSPHLDHIYPVSKGGLNIIENLVWCCSTCNSVKSDKGLITFIKKHGLDIDEVSARLKALGKHI